MNKLKKIYVGRVAIITGAASGIGHALATLLTELGAHVVWSDRDSDRLATPERATTSKAAALYLPVDVTQADQVGQLIEQAHGHFGRIDFLFNNAGISGLLPIERATLAHWENILAINLWGVIHGIQAVLPIMKAQGAGHIVNTASLSGLLPFPGQALYVTSKHAVVGLSESLRHELAADGIAVSVACPGAVATEIWGKSLDGSLAPPRPADAMPARDAALAILQGVAERKGIIITPAAMKTSWRWFRWFPSLLEKTFRQMSAYLRQKPGYGG